MKGTLHFGVQLISQTNITTILNKSEIQTCFTYNNLYGIGTLYYK